MDKDDADDAEEQPQPASKEELVREFWREVYRLLKSEHELSSSTAIKAVEMCRAEVEGPRVGDALYNSGARRVAGLAAKLLGRNPD